MPTIGHLPPAGDCCQTGSWIWVNQDGWVCAVQLVGQQFFLSFNCARMPAIKLQHRAQEWVILFQVVVVLLLLDFLVHP